VARPVIEARAVPALRRAVTSTPSIMIGEKGADLVRAAE